jgi:hypothetical protein
MKGNILKKARLASAVMLATSVMAIGTTAQADSLLAPFVVDDEAWDTYFAFKMQGSSPFSLVGNPTDPIHYTWIQKGTQMAHLFVGFTDRGPTVSDNDDTAYTPRPCTVYDNFGQGTQNDVIFQSARGRMTSTDPVTGVITNLSGDPSFVDPAIDFFTAGFWGDRSNPNGYNNGANVGTGTFAGMVVIDDTANTDVSGGDPSLAPEGNMSGFAYVFNVADQDVFSYKLLNNHKSAVSGDMSAGFISKHVVDFMWLPDDTATVAGQNRIPTQVQNPPVAGTSNVVYPNMNTYWLAAVTGPDMANHTDGYNSTYGLQAVFSTNQRGAGLVVNERDVDLESPPTEGFAQAYNHDESALSGDDPLTITCMGVFQRDSFLTDAQTNSSSIGGWARRSVIPLEDGFADANTPKIAEGAIVYRFDSFFGRSQTTMQVETGGHLNLDANHANRPY